jgi:hypothetical protein
MDQIITYYYPVALAYAGIVMNIFIAMAVYRDAQNIQSKIGTELMFFQPGIWSLVCVIGGIPALALYWVIHYAEFLRKHKS